METKYFVFETGHIIKETIRETDGIIVSDNQRMFIGDVEVAKKEITKDEYEEIEKYLILEAEKLDKENIDAIGIALEKQLEQAKTNYETLIKEGNSPTLAKLVSGYNPDLEQSNTKEKK